MTIQTQTKTPAKDARRGGKPFNQGRREEPTRKPVLAGETVVLIEKGAGFAIKKKTTFDKNACNKPISVVYLLERDGAEKAQEFTRLFDAREASKATATASAAADKAIAAAAESAPQTSETNQAA